MSCAIELTIIVVFNYFPFSNRFRKVVEDFHKKYQIVVLMSSSLFAGELSLFPFVYYYCNRGFYISVDHCIIIFIIFIIIIIIIH